MHLLTPAFKSNQRTTSHNFFILEIFASNFKVWQARNWPQWDKNINRLIVMRHWRWCLHRQVANLRWPSYHHSVHEIYRNQPGATYQQMKVCVQTSKHILLDDTHQLQWDAPPCRCILGLDHCCHVPLKSAYVLRRSAWHKHEECSDFMQIWRWVSPTD